MRDVDRGDAEPALELPQLDAHALTELRVEARERLVEEEQLRLSHERARERESLLLTSLEHPSIPTIYDYFYDEPLSRFYLVMKFISGGDLASRLRTAPGGRHERSLQARRELPHVRYDPLGPG